MTHNAGIGIASSPIAAIEAGLSTPTASSRVAGIGCIASIPVSGSLPATLRASNAVMGIGCVAGSPVSGVPVAASRLSNEISTVVIVSSEAALVGRTANGVPGGVRNFDPTKQALAKKKRKPRRLNIEVGIPVLSAPSIEQSPHSPEDFSFGGPFVHFAAAASPDFHVSSAALLSRLVENLAAPLAPATSPSIAAAHPVAPITLRGNVVSLHPENDATSFLARQQREADADDEAAIAIILALAA